MNAPEPLLLRLARNPQGSQGKRRLIVVMGQLGDFDSLEYAMALVEALPRLQQSGISLLAFAIGNDAGAARFCTYTGFPRTMLEVDADPTLHQQLGLYSGLQAPGGPWPGLLLMCAGIGSPGTLAEVLRGYRGDRRAPERIAVDQSIKIATLPAISGALFARLGRGYQRPFELATVRLQNMVEVLGHWRTYVPRDDFISQRGATYVLEADNQLLYAYQERGLLGYSATMARPLSFLDPYLVATPHQG